MTDFNKKIRVGITTLHGYHNYGNKLQNYALSKYLIDMNYDVDSLHFEVMNIQPRKKSKYNKIKTIFNLKKMVRLINNITNRLLTDQKKSDSERADNFKLFSIKFLNESIKQILLEDLDNLNNEYDFFITGSDQVWNPLAVNQRNFFKYFLIFVEKEKSISYAASFGISKLDDEYKKNYKKWLSDFNYISVREDNGALIIKELLGIDVPVHVDPTLLLTKHQWLEIAKKHELRPKKYVLTYFLGKQERKFYKELRVFAEDNDCELINLNNIKDKERYIIDPSEFLDYFNNAKIIFTDSFHGSVFSILFEKPFVVFNRGNMNSRIDTLLSKFKLENRHWDFVKENKNFFNIDYNHVEDILEEEREKSYNYLKEALSIKEE